jgi:hypothetical protein
MLFKVKFEGKALENHVFQTNKSTDEGLCRIWCYMDDRCLSYNYGADAKGDKEICELSESDHVMHNEDLVDRPDTIYYGADVSISAIVIYDFIILLADPDENGAI